MAKLPRMLEFDYGARFLRAVLGYPPGASQHLRAADLSRRIEELDAAERFDELVAAFRRDPGLEPYLVKHGEWLANPEAKLRAM